MAENQAILSEFEAASRMPVPRSIADYIQRLILKGGLKAGDRLPSQRELADQLGVSRPSLREALTVLETIGLVSVRAGSGVFVARSDLRGPIWRYADRCTPADVYEARLGLEGYAARLAAMRVDEAAIARLNLCAEAMGSAYKQDDIIGIAAADAEFHDLIFELCGNPMLAAMYRPVREILVESQRLPMMHRDLLGETVNEHRVIHDCIVGGDPVAAEEAMHLHIRAAAARYGISI
jgi:GntR family transcriptional regulator, transcriptional repressor for pyruvate dehydrogenase complex